MVVAAAAASHKRKPTATTKATNNPKRPRWPQQQTGHSPLHLLPPLSPIPTRRANQSTSSAVSFLRRHNDASTLPRRSQPQYAAHDVDTTKSTGPWSEHEKELFLRGLLRFGWGQWKAIEAVIQSRSNRQIISHSQKVAARWNAGVDVFECIRASARRTSSAATAAIVNDDPPTLLPSNSGSEHAATRIAHCHSDNEVRDAAKILWCLKGTRPHVMA